MSRLIIALITSTAIQVACKAKTAREETTQAPPGQSTAAQTAGASTPDSAMPSKADEPVMASAPAPVTSSTQRRSASGVRREAASPPSPPIERSRDTVTYSAAPSRHTAARAAPGRDDAVAATLEGVPANADLLAPTDTEFTRVRVFYGTTRVRVDLPTPEKFYGPVNGGALELGVATVTIPLLHRPGEIESRGRRWQTFYLTRERPDPAKHMLIQSVTPLTDTVWTATFHQALDSAPSKDVLVYVHGYNNSFADATLRAAQLVYDVKAGENVVAMFSWPSKAEPQWYLADEDAVVVAIPAFKRFLLALVDSIGAARVQIVGHSMGTRMIAATLQSLAADGRASVVSDVVLAAADINAEVFRDQIAPSMKRTAGRVTMYTSAGDHALMASHTIHRDQRAGENAAWLSLIAGVDVIDATRAKADWLDHGYVQENKALLDDMFMLLSRGLPPNERNLLAVRRDSLRYWAVP